MRSSTYKAMELSRQHILLRRVVVDGPALGTYTRLDFSFALQTMDNSLELTTLLNTGKLVKDSEVNTAEKYEFILSAMLKSSMRVVLFSLSATRSLVPIRNELT